jgi:hypothetical protein
MYIIIAHCNGMDEVLIGLSVTTLKGLAEKWEIKYFTVGQSGLLL